MKIKTLRLGLKIITVLLKDNFFYPKRLLVDTIQTIGRCLIILLLYAYVFKARGGNILSSNFAEVAWSMFGYFSFSSLRLRDLSNNIMSDVQSGNISNFFSKPFSYLYYKYFWQIGLGLYSFLVTFIIGIALMFFTIGISDTSFTASLLPIYFITILFCILLSLLFYSCIGLTAFWIEDAKSIHWIADKFVMILGGSYLPVAFFPDFMKKIAIYSPMGASQFISHFPYALWLENWSSYLLIQFIWSIILILLTAVIYIFASKKLSTNGG